MIHPHTNNLKSKIKSYPAKFVSKQNLLNLSLILCLTFSSCNAIKDAANRAQHHKNTNQKDSTQLKISSYDQIAPIKGKVISPFGYRGRHNHTGTDIKLQRGDTVRAAYCGRVSKAAPYSGYGNLVILKHTNKIETYYGHLSKCLVHEGDSVKAGEAIGLGGRTGRASTDHLHFEVRYNKAPNNPENYFDFSNGAVKIRFLAYAPATKKSSPEPKTIFIASKSKEESSTMTKMSEDFVIIKKGDTLYALAKQYGTTTKQLLEINNLKNSALSLGMKLKIK